MQRISADDFCSRQFPAAIQKTQPAAGKGKTAVCPKERRAPASVSGAPHTSMQRNIFFLKISRRFL